MSLRFICCSCGRFLEVRDSLAGRRVRCPGCSTVVWAECEAPLATLVDAPPPPAAEPPLHRGRMAVGLAIAGYAWALGFLYVASQINDAFGLATLGATYLVAPGALCRYAKRQGGLLGDAALLGGTVALLAVATGFFIPPAVRLTRERLQRQSRAEPEGRTRDQVDRR